MRIVWDRYERAIKLYVRSFDHGLHEPAFSLWFGECILCLLRVMI